jgi:hypothetical protein
LAKELPHPLPWPGGDDVPLVAGVPDGTASETATASDIVVAPDPVTAAKETGNDSFAAFIERLVNQQQNRK